MTTAQPISLAPRRGNLRAGIVLAIAGFFLVAVRQHLFSINSHYYYTWPWKWIDSKTVYPIVLPLAIPFFAAQLLYLRRPALAWLALSLMTVSLFCLMLGAAAVQKNPPSFSRISDVVQSRWTTGYFDEASVLAKKHLPVREILSRYPTLLPHFYLHPRTKPPGLVLFELAIIRLFGPGAPAAMISGLMIAIFAAGSVVATYGFILVFTENRNAAFCGASYLALCPSMVLFYPEFDVCYPVVTVCITALWRLSLRKNRIRYSVLLGIAYAATALVTYLPGVLPVFLIGVAFLEFFELPKQGLTRIFTHAVASLAAFILFYAALWAITGFNPIATFQACLDQVDVMWGILINKYHYPPHLLPGTIPADLYDFAVGSAWISYPLVFCYFISQKKRGFTPETRIALVCVCQFLFVAFTGAVTTETSRTWCFMLPMLMLPIGLELANWSPRARFAVYAALLLLTAAMCQSMEFVGSAI